MCACAIISLVMCGACAHNNSSSAENDAAAAVESQDPVCTMLCNFYDRYVLRTAPTNSILHQVCTPRMQRMLNRASRQQDGDTCSTCMTITPFITDDISTLRFADDANTQVLHVTPDAHSLGWYHVHYIYHGDTLQVRLRVIDTPDGHRIDSLSRK